MFKFKYIALSVATAILIPTAHADHFELSTIAVTGSNLEANPYPLPEFPVATPDSADLAKRLPGTHINRNGPLTPIVQYRGLFSDRVNVMLDGVRVSQAGPNSMDASLSYLPASRVGEIELYRGIAPVSSGIETIGGTLVANSRQPEFGSGREVEFHGHAHAGYASNPRSHQTAVTASISNENNRAYIAASRDKGRDARFDGGRILPSQHNRDTLSVGYGFKFGQASEAGFDVQHVNTTNTGTAALPMDIQYVRGENYRANLKTELSNGDQLSFRLHYQDVDHLMDNFSLRQAPADAMRWRETFTDVLARGMQIRYQMQNWQLGFDMDQSRYNTTIFNPNNAMFFVQNFNNASRDRYSVFAEWDGELNEVWSLQSGVRYSHVVTNADAVDSNGPMGAVVALRDRFNEASRRKSNDLFDIAAVFTRELRSDLDLELGIARKQRAPSYQERYLWAPFESTAGLADGNTYLGNVNLKPETAYQFELGLNWHPRQIQISPRLFYHHINNFIQGTPTTDATAIMANNMMSMSGRDPLQFSNVDAKLYGLDTNWFAALTDHWQLEGTVSYVRGKRRDTGDNLYRIAPLTARTMLSYVEPSWQLGLEVETIAAQRKVSSTNLEQKTSGYALFNLSGRYQPVKDLTVTAGINNLFDRRYQDHLGGYNRVMGNPDIGVLDRLPGIGRNAYVNLGYQW